MHQPSRRALQDRLEIESCETGNAVTTKLSGIDNSAGFTYCGTSDDNYCNEDYADGCGEDYSCVEDDEGDNVCE